MSIRFNTLAALLAPALLLHDVRAQTPQEPLQEFEPVVVTAARIQQPLTQALPVTTVIDQARIQASSAADVADLLAREAGVEIARAGGAGQPAAVFMRGMESRHTLVLLDGVPLTGESFNTALIEALPLTAIERIEVVRGNVSALYGSNAVGGVIQIFTRKGGGALQGRASVGAGTQRSGRISAGLSGGGQGSRYAVDVGRRITDGVSALDPQQSPEAADRDGQQATTVSASLQHRFNAQLQLGAQAYRSAQTVDYDLSGSAQDVQAESRLSTYSGSVQLDPHARWQSLLRAARFDERRRYLDQGAEQSQYRSQRDLVAWDNTIALAQDLQATLGAEHERNSATISTLFSPEFDRARSVSAVRVGVVSSSDSLQWQLNLRHDRDADTGLAGAGFTFMPNYSVLAQVSSAYVRPTTVQLFDPLYGNPALKPERARNAELALQWAKASQRVRLTAFANRTLDLVGFDPVTFASINIDRTRNRGAEVLAELRLQDLAVRASFTQQSPRDETTGQPLLRRAKTLATIAVEGGNKLWQWAVDAKFVGARNDLAFDPATFASSTVRLPSATVLGAGLSWRASQYATVRLRADNVTDANDTTVYGYSRTPRSVQASVDLVF
jgi:vitamin B12 transporter